MKKLVILSLLVLCLPVVSMVNIVYLDDMNKDGVEEKISYRETTGGNNIWGKLIITRRGKVIFSPSELHIDDTTYRILDVIPRFPGKEIIIIEFVAPPDNLPKATGYAFDVYRWDKVAAKYVLYQHAWMNKPCRNGDCKIVIADLLTLHLPRLMQMEKLVSKFISAAKNGDWETVKSLLSKTDAMPFSCFENNKTVFMEMLNDPSCWSWWSPLHDAKYIYTVCSVPMDNQQKSIYEIVIAPDGISSFILAGGEG